MKLENHDIKNFTAIQKEEKLQTNLNYEYRYKNPE